MNLKQIVNCFSLFILAALFLWQTVFAIMKYLEKTTVVHTINIDEDLILFPSITVCKKVSNGLYEREIKDSSANIDDKIYKLHFNAWTKNEIFYFFSHPTMFNQSFPCTTLEGTGTSPGKPCSFPLFEFGEISEKCNVNENCWTR